MAGASVLHAKSVCNHFPDNACRILAVPGKKRNTSVFVRTPQKRSIKPFHTVSRAGMSCLSPVQGEETIDLLEPLQKRRNRIEALL